MKVECPLHQYIRHIRDKWCTIIYWCKSGLGSLIVKLPTVSRFGNFCYRNIFQTDYAHKIANFDLKCYNDCTIFVKKDFRKKFLKSIEF